MSPAQLIHGVGPAGVLALLSLLAPGLARAQFTCTTNAGAITITGYTGPGGAVTVPAQLNGLPVTTIGRNAFLTSLKLTSVVLPSTVTNILHGAFDQCGSLTQVIMPGKVTSIEDNAFAECTSLVDFTLPDSLVNISHHAFAFCASLPKVVIPDGVTNIAPFAFFSCDGLSSFTVGPGNLNYSSQDGVLFDKTQTTLLQCPGAKSGAYAVPASVTAIGDNAFLDCARLTNIFLPGGLVQLGQDVFSSCTSLVSITLPAGIAALPEGTFNSCAGLTNVVLPAGLTNLGDDAFYYCTSLTHLAIPASVSSLGVDVFAGSGLTSLVLPVGLTNIGDYEFSGCGNLTQLIVPASVTHIGTYAFSSCRSLQAIDFEGPAPNVISTAFFSATPTLYALPGAAGWGTNLAGRPVGLWLPQVQTNGNGFGVGMNGFSFTVTWARGAHVLVETSTNLAAGSWSPLQTNTLATGSFAFADPFWPSWPARFFRLRPE